MATRPGDKWPTGGSVSEVQLGIDGQSVRGVFDPALCRAAMRQAVAVGSAAAIIARASRIAPARFSLWPRRQSWTPPRARL